MKRFICKKCGHEIYTNEKPDPIKWTDGHVCYFTEVSEDYNNDIDFNTR